MKRTPQSKSVNYLEGFWLRLFWDILIRLGKSRDYRRPHLKALINGLSVRGAVSHLPRRVKIEWVIIAFLLALLLGGARARVIPEPINLPPPHKLISALPEPHIEPVAALEPVPVPEPTPAPTPVYTAPVAVTSSVTNCGSDSMMAYIYTVESGCRSWAINPGGCIGLGQACPGGKLPCGLYDWACQDAWFRNYAVAAYGSIYNAYIFRQSHNWW